MRGAHATTAFQPEEARLLETGKQGVDVHRGSAQSERVPTVTLFPAGMKGAAASKRIAADFATPSMW